MKHQWLLVDDAHFMEDHISVFGGFSIPGSLVDYRHKSHDRKNQQHP